MKEKKNFEKSQGKVRSSFVKQEPAKSGRPNVMDEETVQKLLEVYYSRPFSLRKLADMFGVSRMTIWRVVQEVPYG